MKIVYQLVLSCFALAVYLPTIVAQEKLKEGDLLFQHLACGPLCEAIEAVTEGVNGKDFAHCALVVKINDTLKVVEATGKQVQINSLKKFFARSGDSLQINNITVGRLKPAYTPLLNDAVKYAIAKVGVPYDNVFLPDNGKLYCSELLYEAFKHANHNNTFFEQQPMTFKDPKTQQFFPAWVTYYQNLKEPIPEGKPGLNPGSVSRSDKLDIITIVSFQ